jgi:hypothetical protein
MHSCSKEFLSKFSKPKMSRIPIKEVMSFPENKIGKKFKATLKTHRRFHLVFKWCNI